MAYVVKDIKVEAKKLKALGVFSEAPGVAKFEGGQLVFTPIFVDENEFTEYKVEMGSSLPSWINLATDRVHLVQNARRIVGIIEDLTNQNILDEVVAEVNRL